MAVGCELFGGIDAGFDRHINGRTVSAVDDNPQSLIFGNGTPRPGPGEPGFSDKDD